MDPTDAEIQAFRDDYLRRVRRARRRQFEETPSTRLIEDTPRWKTLETRWCRYEDDGVRCAKPVQARSSISKLPACSMHYQRERRRTW